MCVWLPELLRVVYSARPHAQVRILGQFQQRWPASCDLAVVECVSVTTQECVVTVPYDRIQSMLRTRQFLLELASHAGGLDPKAMGLTTESLLRPFPTIGDLALSSRVLSLLCGRPGRDARVPTCSWATDRPRCGDHHVPD